MRGLSPSLPLYANLDDDDDIEEAPLMARMRAEAMESFMVLVLFEEKEKKMWVLLLLDRSKMADVYHAKRSNKEKSGRGVSHASIILIPTCRR